MRRVNPTPPPLDVRGNVYVRKAKGARGKFLCLARDLTYTEAQKRVTPEWIQDAENYVFLWSAEGNAPTAHMFYLHETQE